jgi:hypothetical protein
MACQTPVHSAVLRRARSSCRARWIIASRALPALVQGVEGARARLARAWLCSRRGPFRVRRGSAARTTLKGQPMRGVRSLILILVIIAAAVVVFAYVRGDHHGGVSGDVKSLWHDTKRDTRDLGKDAEDKGKDVGERADGNKSLGDKIKDFGRDTGDKVRDATK